MWEDVIVEEVRQIRQCHAEKFNFDPWAIFQDLKEQERKSQRKLLKFPPRCRQHARPAAKKLAPRILQETQSS